MFTVKAGYANDIEVRSSIDKVREFFADVSNFAELMPGITQIHTDAKGIAHWRIQAEIPFVGQMLQKFAVELAEDSEDRIEWSPIRVETENFLRYSADFLEKAKNVTSSISHKWSSSAANPPATCTTSQASPESR